MTCDSAVSAALIGPLAGASIVLATIALRAWLARRYPPRRKRARKVVTGGQESAVRSAPSV